MNFKNGKELLELCEKEKCALSDIMLLREVMETDRAKEEVLDQTHRTWNIMKNSAAAPIRSPKKSIGGLIGGEAKRLSEQRTAGRSILSRCSFWRSGGTFKWTL